MRVLALFGLTVAVVTLAGPATAAPVPKHLMKEPESDKAKLQGKWKVQSIQMGGKNVLADLNQNGLNIDMEIEFQGDKFIATINLTGTVQKITATVKYGTNGMKQLTTTESQAVDGAGKPVNTGSRDASLGYAFDGDQLLLAADTDGKKATNPLKPGPNDQVMVLTRVKK